MIDAVDVLGCLASVAGLVVSVYALIAARSAKRAAEEARDAVYRENLEDELRQMTVLADQMLSAIRRKEQEGVGSTATGLLASTEHAISRWGHYLPQEQLGKLKDVPELIASISRTVILDGVPEDPAKLRRMVDKCQNAMRTMNSVLGSIQIKSESDHE